jgi:hypothetical protein
MRRIQALCCLLLLGVTGCDFFVPQNQHRRHHQHGDYLYVGNGNNTYIAGFGVSSAGALSVLTSSPYNNGVAAQSLAVTPTNTFLYAGTTNGIYVYAINSDGSITVQNSGSLRRAGCGCHGDAGGQHGKLSAGSRNLDLASGPGDRHLPDRHHHRPVDRAHRFSSALYTGKATTATVVTPTAMLITPNNSYVYVSLGSLGVQVLTLGSGALSAPAPQPPFFRR